MRENFGVARFSPVIVMTVLFLVFVAGKGVYEDFFKPGPKRDLAFLECVSEDYETSFMVLWDQLNFELASISTPFDWGHVALPIDDPDFFTEHFFSFQETWADEKSRKIAPKNCGLQCFQIDRVTLAATLQTIGRKDSDFQCSVLSETEAIELFTDQVTRYLEQEAKEEQRLKDEVDSFKI